MMNIDPNKFVNQRKRSSLRQRNLFPEGMTYEEYMASKSKKLQWDTQVDKIEIVKEDIPTANSEDMSDVPMTNEPKIQEAKVKSSKEVVDSIKEENEEQENEKQIVFKQEIHFEEKNNQNFDNLRKKSIKNEFQLAKDLLKIQLAETNEDLETDEAEETSKNTCYNKNVGQLNDDEDDDDDNDSDY